MLHLQHICGAKETRMQSKEHTPMAHAATHSAHWSPLAAIAGVFSAIGGFFTSVAMANARYQQIIELQNLTDEELSERGLTRDEIVHHVFSDAYYI
jgi:hypothetical protein